MKKSHKFQIFKKSDKMKQNISQNIDSGRSMVEMLGVLAVIGVLSIASILGYRYAMAKWRANETVNELNIRAYDIATRFDKLVAANTTDIEMEMGDTTRLGYPITARISPQYEDYFEMFVSDVPTDVCKELLNSQWQAPYSIFVRFEEFDANPEICEQAENVQLAYEFYKDLSDRDEIPEEVQHKIQRCDHDNNCQCGTCDTETEICVSRCTANERCEKLIDNPYKKDCCDKNDSVNGYCCTSVDASGRCCNSEGGCCFTTEPLIDQNGNCHTCDDPNTFTMNNITLCTQHCPNRQDIGNNKCALRCTNTQFRASDDKCYECDDKTPRGATDAECGKCTKRLRTNDTCALKCEYVYPDSDEKMILNMYGQCEKCSKDGNINVWNYAYHAQCESCGNRKMTNTGSWGSYCYKTCTDPAYPLMAQDGTCQPCTYSGSVYNISLIDSCTNLCSNRKESDGKCILSSCPTGYFLSTDGGCYKCDDVKPRGATTAECSKCTQRLRTNDTCALKCEYAYPDSDEKMILNRNGECEKCSKDGNINIWNYAYHAQCDSCGNRRMTSTGSYGSYCYKTCTDPAYPLMAQDGTCQPCTYNGTVYNISLADSCTNLCDNRKESGDKCILSSCPSGYFLSTDGTCYDCDDKTPHGATDAECKKCSKRLRTHSTCALKCEYAYPDSDEKMILNQNGECEKCSKVDVIDIWNYTYHAQCDSCGNRRMTSTGSYGSYCERVSCPGEKRLEGSDKECRACNTLEEVPVESEEKCAICTNRTYQNGLCILNDTKK